MTVIRCSAVNGDDLDAVWRGAVRATSMAAGMRRSCSVSGLALSLAPAAPVRWDRGQTPTCPHTVMPGAASPVYAPRTW